MPRRIPEEEREEISRLYDQGLRPSEIARQTGVSYASVYGMTKARQRINPDTGEKFKSGTEYEYHLAKQRINPETEKPFESKMTYYKSALTGSTAKRGRAFPSLGLTTTVPVS